MPFLSLLVLILFTNHVDTLITCSSTRSRTVQLNVTHIERTWQPKGHVCPWMPSESELSTSGPHWFVIELKQSYYIEQINLLNADGEWQTAGAVGSQASALVAANLPLELQLEDPCNAGWEIMRCCDSWKPLGDLESQTPVSFIMLISQQPLKTMQILGKETPLTHKILHPVGRSFKDLQGFETDHELHLSVNSCTDGFVECFKLRRSGRRSRSLTVINSFPHQTNELTGRSFEFKMRLRYGDDHGALLVCKLNNRTALTETITTKIRVKALDILAPSLFVNGKTVKIVFTSESFPEPRHMCSVTSNLTSRNMALVSQRRWPVKTETNLTALRLQSTFALNVSMSLLESEILCNFRGADMTTATAKHIIKNITEPCVTSVGLGSSPYWIEGQQRLIQISSHNCTIWSASHTCWLTKTSKPMCTEPLIKINETQFTSIHQVEVSRWMAQSDWSVRCRVNQSGIEYEDDLKSSMDPRLSVFCKNDQAVLSLTSNHFNGTHLVIDILCQYSKLPVSSVLCSVYFAEEGANKEFKQMSLVFSAGKMRRFEVNITTGLSNKTMAYVSCYAHQVYQDKMVFHSAGNFPILLEQINGLMSFQSEKPTVSEKESVVVKIELNFIKITLGAAALLVFLCLALGITWRIAVIRASTNMIPASDINDSNSSPYCYETGDGPTEEMLVINRSVSASGNCVRLSLAGSSVYDSPTDELAADQDYQISTNNTDDGAYIDVKIIHYEYFETEPGKSDSGTQQQAEAVVYINS